MECCSYDTRKFFLFWMRIFFGIWLFYAGISKWIFMGPDSFVGYIVSEFAKTWSPAILNELLAWLIMIAEPLLGLFLITGVRSRTAWMLTSLLMFMLMFGQTLLMSKDIGSMWIYLVLTLSCAALSDPEQGWSCCSKK